MLTRSSRATTVQREHRMRSDNRQSGSLAIHRYRYSGSLAAGQGHQETTCHRFSCRHSWRQVIAGRRRRRRRRVTWHGPFLWSWSSYFTTHSPDPHLGCLLSRSNAVVGSTAAWKVHDDQAYCHTSLVFIGSVFLLVYLKSFFASPLV